MESLFARSFLDRPVGTKAAVFLVVLSMFLWGSAQAMHKVPYTALEYDSWPDICKGHIFTMPPSAGQKLPKLSEKQEKLRWKVGGWHYCHGLLWVRRAELARGTANAKKWAGYGISEIDYSLTRIDINEPWAAEMLVTRARALRVKGNVDAATELIKKAIEHHPNYGPAYLAMAQIYFDEKNYQSALEVLKQGELATSSKDAEVQYFLGLAYFYVGNIDKAIEYEEKSRLKGYRLRGLARKIDKHQASGSK